MLKPYNPVPSLVTKQTKIDKPKFPVIDIHCHWSMEQDPEELLRAMDELGVRTSVNLSGGTGEDFDALMRKFNKVAPERLLVMCNVDFRKIDDPGFGQMQADWLADARSKGAAGLKIFKSLGLTTTDGSGKVIAVDDPRLDPIWAKCGELKMPVLIHSADPLAFFEPTDARNERWMQLQRHPGWSFHGEQFPDYAEVMAQHNHVLAKHRNTVFISAHLANSGEHLDQLSKWLDEHPNLYVDMSGREAELGRQPYAGRRFMLTYQDRVLFGTDRYPGRPDQPRHLIYYRLLETDDEYFNYYDHPFPPTGDWKVYGLHLPDDVLKKVYYENAQRALDGLMPIK